MAERLPTIEEVRQLVDDPGIDDETKRTLLVRYFDAIGDVDPVVYGFANENEKKELLESYQDRFGFTDRDLQDGAFAYDAYSAAQGKHDANMQAAREAQARAVDDGKARLDSMKGSDTSPGAANSNEILDAGVPGLDSFRVWLPVYSRARAVAAPGLPDFRLQELIDRYDEQRDIPFDKFAAGVTEIVQVRESVADAAPSQNSAMQALFGSWEGDGKSAAAASWTKFGDGVRAVEQSLEHAADVVNRTIAAVAGSCRDKASWVLQYAFQTWPQQQGLTAQDTDRLARIAELGRNASADDFKHFIPFLLGQQSPLAGQLLVGSSFGMSDELLDAVQSWAKSWLAEFCRWFAGFVGEFQTMCENTRVAVAAQWSALNTELQQVPDNPFAAVGEAAPVAPRSSGAGGAGGSGGGAAGLAGGAGAGGGSAGGAGFAGGAGPAGATPPLAPPVVPPAVAPAVPAAAPVPDEQDTLTVQRGDSKLELTEPDQTGRMAIKIDNGDGQPKDYQLTWGTPDPAAPAYTPAADGKIHIDDGPLHITADRPAGETGPTVITLDDGTGTPTTYTLGEEPTAPGGPGSVPGAPTTYPLGEEPTARPATPGSVGSAPGLSTDPAQRLGATGALGGPGQSAGAADFAPLADGTGTPTTYALDEEPAGGPATPGSVGAAPGLSTDPAQRLGATAELGGLNQPAVAADSISLADAAQRSAAGAFDDLAQPAAASGPLHAQVQGAGADGAPDGAQATMSGAAGAGPHLADPAGPGAAGYPSLGGQEHTTPAAALGGVSDGLAEQGAVSGSLGDPGSIGHSSAPPASGAALGTAPGLDPVGAAVDPSGMSMLGGLPPAAAGNQGGEDPERSSRAYRVDGDIFDSPGSGGRISGSLDEEETRR
ncbi:WXG100 family type VII secretion target [Amycolatopsis tucumanensis]|uniref:WXG100 family type VII secretion target n=1 Tax=Amycolatopsis tucumanensis TaxID=401106 RepID=UPI003D73EDEE